MRQEIGLRLREERERLGLSQTEFAALGDVSKRTQVDWEAGVATPNAEFLAIAEAHGADVMYIVTGKRNEVGLPDDEAMFLAGFRALDGRGKDLVLGLLMAMDLRPQATPWEFCREMQLLKAFRAASPEQKTLIDIAREGNGK